MKLFSAKLENSVEGSGRTQFGFENFRRSTIGELDDDVLI